MGSPLLQGAQSARAITEQPATSLLSTHTLLEDGTQALVEGKSHKFTIVKPSFLVQCTSPKSVYASSTERHPALATHSQLPEQPGLAVLQGRPGRVLPDGVLGQLLQLLPLGFQGGEVGPQCFGPIQQLLGTQGRLPAQGGSRPGEEQRELVGLVLELHNSAARLLPLGQVEAEVRLCLQEADRDEKVPPFRHLQHIHVSPGV